MMPSPSKLTTEEWAALRHVWFRDPVRLLPDPRVVRRLISQDLIQDEHGTLAVTASGRRTIVSGCPTQWSNAL